MKGIMPGRRLSEAERTVQPGFNLMGWLGGGLVAAIVVFASGQSVTAPDRVAMPPRTIPLTAEPLSIAPTAVQPLRLAGAWRLTAPDPRFGGLSALAMDSGALIALTDSGVSLRFAPPGDKPATVAIHDLPDGPGSATRKVNRDSESLARDSSGRGWWVGYETNNQLWLYTPDFRRPLGRIDFGSKRWMRNRGLEAMIDGPDGLLFVPEPAQEVVLIGMRGAVTEPLAGAGSRISDMVRLPDGEMIVLLRELGLTGFRNALGALVQAPAGWRVERRVPLALGVFMNGEGLATQPLPNGGTRLWLVTDDNFRRPLTTALFALDLPPGRWTGRKSD